MNTDDPDLREFRDRGGKMIGYHGLVCYLNEIQTDGLIAEGVLTPNRQISSSPLMDRRAITMPSQQSTSPYMTTTYSFSHRD